MNSSIFAPSTPHYVYIVNQPLNNHELVCKIGYSKDTDRRVKELQTGNDKKLNVCKKFIVAHNRYDADIIEKKIQRMFKEFKREGEWFAFDPLYLVNTVIPQIESFVKQLDIKRETHQITKIANQLMSKREYMKIKTRQIQLKSMKTLTLEQELEMVVCTNALAKDKNLEKVISREKNLARRREGGYN